MQMFRDSYYFCPIFILYIDILLIENGCCFISFYPQKVYHFPFHFLSIYVSSYQKVTFFYNDDIKIS